MAKRKRYPWWVAVCEIEMLDGWADDRCALPTKKDCQEAIRESRRWGRVRNVRIRPLDYADGKES